MIGIESSRIIMQLPTQHCFFFQPRDHVLVEGNKLMQPVSAILISLTKVICKTVVMEYILSKVADRQPETF